MPFFIRPKNTVKRKREHPKSAKLNAVAHLRQFVALLAYTKIFWSALDRSRKKFPPVLPNTKKIAKINHKPKLSEENGIDVDDDDEDIESDYEKRNGLDSASEDEDVHMTAQEKKVQLAKKYISEIEKQESERLLDEYSDNASSNLILKRLRDEELEKSGKLRVKLTDSVNFDARESFELKCKEHKLTITCVATSADNLYLYSASKDCSIVRWCLAEKKHIASTPSKLNRNYKSNPKNNFHKATINCLAISRENKYLASGDDEGCVKLWNPFNLTHMQTIKAHKGAVLGLSICRESEYLFSTGRDSLVKVWIYGEQLSYVETLFGHQTFATSVDVLRKDRVVTSGGTDNTIRVWKIQEESQLIYNGHRGSIDMVRRLDEEHFVSGGDDGAICLWGTHKKKPLCVVPRAHGVNPANDQPLWINCVAAYPNSDMFASGSCDSAIRVWKCGDGYTKVTLKFTIPALGYVNSLSFTTDQSLLVAAVGKEHRLGRWNCVSSAKNCLLCIPIKKIS